MDGTLAAAQGAADMCQHSAVYADKILKGAKPTAVEQPTKFELLVNLKTAAALGINVPLQLQQLADEGVEEVG
jgi:putative ABC transport system substrate-binding protein